MHFLNSYTAMSLFDARMFSEYNELQSMLS